MRELFYCCEGIRAVSRIRLDIEDRHLMLKWINIDVEDLCILPWLTLGWNPWGIAVEHDDNVGRLDCIVHPEAEAQPARVVRREAHVATARVSHPKTLDGVGQLDKCAGHLMISARVPCYYEGFFCPRQGLGDFLYAALRQTSQLNRAPLLLI